MKIRYSTCSTARSRSASARPAGSPNGAPSVADASALARLIRCAIVASGTRNAARDLGGRQAADRPQRQRDRRRGRERRVAAQEQQQQRVVGSARASAGARSVRDARRASSRRRRASSLPDRRSAAGPRPGSASRAGCPGTPRPATASPPPAAPPAPRPRPSSKSPVPADDHAEDLRRERRAAGPRRLVRVPSRARPRAAAPITGRTSIGMLSGAPSTPGAADALAAISYARLGGSTVDDPEADQELLRLRERPVGDGGPPSSWRTIRAWSGKVSPSSKTSSPASVSSLSKVCWNSMWCLHVLRRPVQDAAGVVAAHVHHQHVLHVRPPVSPDSHRRRRGLDTPYQDILCPAGWERSRRQHTDRCATRAPHGALLG